MKILIIGGGFAGCSSAEMLSKIRGTKITLVEKSKFLGAGVRTFTYGGHPYTFGPRHFLTNKKETYLYLKKFLKLRNCNYHQFKSYVESDNQFYNYPINFSDIELMPDKAKIKKELKQRKNKKISAKNLEEFWLKSIGPTLYKKIIDNYNKKMWLVNSNKNLDTFNWSPKGYTIKKGSRAAFDDHISCYPVAKDGYNQYFDKAFDYLKESVNYFHSINVSISEKTLIDGIRDSDFTTALSKEISLLSKDLYKEGYLILYNLSIKLNKRWKENPNINSKPIIFDHPLSYNYIDNSFNFYI